ncbi:MAG: hypothetical protein K5764_02140 [Prevotella sp.]|nr:hypothetical protein [Prevotella sp.]
MFNENRSALSRQGDKVHELKFQLMFKQRDQIWAGIRIRQQKYEAAGEKVQGLKFELLQTTGANLGWFPYQQKYEAAGGESTMAEISALVNNGLKFGLVSVSAET